MFPSWYGRKSCSHMVFSALCRLGQTKQRKSSRIVLSIFPPPLFSGNERQGRRFCVSCNSVGCTGKQTNEIKLNFVNRICSSTFTFDCSHLCVPPTHRLLWNLIVRGAWRTRWASFPPPRLMFTDTLFQSTRAAQVKTRVKPVAGIRAALNNTEIWAGIISFIVFYVWKMEISLFAPLFFYFSTEGGCSWP